MIKMFFKKIREYLAMGGPDPDPAPLNDRGSYVTFKFLVNEKVHIEYSDKATIETFELICRTPLLNSLIRQKIGMDPLDVDVSDVNTFNFLPSSFSNTEE